MPHEVDLGLIGALIGIDCRIVAFRSVFPCCLDAKERRSDDGQICVGV